MAISQTIHLTQDKHEPIPIMYAVQNDTGRTALMVIDDITLASGSTGGLYFRRSDGSTYNTTATLSIASNAFTADITQGLTQSGTTECQLKVTASSKKVSTYTFLIKVQEDLNGVSTEQLGYSVADLMNAADSIADSTDILNGLLASGSLAYDVAEITDSTGFVFTPNMSVSYDSGALQYHFSGAATGGGSTVHAYNVYLNTTGFPDGISAGKTYYYVATDPDNAFDSANFSGSVYYKTASSDWTFITSGNANNVRAFTIPNNAVGLLFRYNFVDGETYDFRSTFRVSDNPYVLCGANDSNSVSLALAPGLYPSDNVRSCEDFEINGTTFCSVENAGSANERKTFSDFPYDAGWLFNMGDSRWGFRVQFAVNYANNATKVRSLKLDGWTDWSVISGGQYLPSCDLNTVTADGSFYLLIDSNTYENAPNGKRVGFLEVRTVSAWTLQLFYSLTEPYIWKRVIFNGTPHTAWLLTGGGSSGGGNTYNITQQISQDTFNNTYNVTANITTGADTNGWINAVDNESTTESNATDMSAAIQSMLMLTGHARLGAGTFYVSGNIDMPVGTILEGCGKKTIIRLLSSVQSGYAVRVSQNNTIKNVYFSGGKTAPTNLYTDGSNFGSKHGVYLIANADGQESSQPASATNIIEGCFFENFDGSAFYMHNTGGGLVNGVIMSDCEIRHSRVGINIDYYAEYSKFANCIIQQCYYACINNGGNNVFVGCTFHGVVGWLCDNSNSDKQNNLHGSCVGCTFNHIDNMNYPGTLGGGVGIHIINGTTGFVFTGCQIWYASVLVENSDGITMSDCLFGRTVSITVTGNHGAFFFNNVHFEPPTINVNSATKFKNCYDMMTGSEIVVG